MAQLHDIYDDDDDDAAILYQEMSVNIDNFHNILRICAEFVTRCTKSAVEHLLFVKGGTGRT